MLEVTIGHFTQGGLVLEAMLKVGMLLRDV